jgi:hypothetical protein
VTTGRPISYFHLRSNMNMIISGQVVLVVICSLFSASICLPVCHDNIPFSTKLAQSTTIFYGEIVEISTPLTPNNTTKSFNLTFFVKCTLKGDRPINQTITIEHSPPGKIVIYHIKVYFNNIYLLENPICYRTLVNGYTYVFFLNKTKKNNYYKQMRFHELSFNDDTTIEILKRTCGIQVRPFHPIINESGEKVDYQCPIVSIGCT